MASKTKRRTASADIHHVALGVGSIVEIWPPGASIDALIDEAWQSTGDMLWDAIAEAANEQEEGPTEEIQATEQVQTGRKTRRSITAPNP